MKFEVIVDVSLRLIQGIKAKKCHAWQHLFGENNG